jgi:hypothetical protein
MPNKESKRLIPTAILASPTFLSDFRSFIGLSAEQLKVVDSLAQTPDGYSPSKQSERLASEAGISSDSATATLRVAEYLYERCREHQIPVEEALDQLADAASSLDISVEDRREILRSILRAKPDYEAGRHASLQAIAALSHFVGIEGVWDIRPVFNRETREIVANVPVLLVSINWHDAVGNNYSAQFQLDEEDWAELRSDFDELEKRWNVIQEQLKRE